MMGLHSPVLPSASPSHHSNFKNGRRGRYIYRRDYIQSKSTLLAFRIDWGQKWEWGWSARQTLEGNYRVRAGWAWRFSGGRRARRSSWRGLKRGRELVVDVFVEGRESRLSMGIKNIWRAEVHRVILVPWEDLIALDAPGVTTYLHWSILIGLRRRTPLG